MEENHEPDFEIIAVEPIYPNGLRGESMMIGGLSDLKEFAQKIADGGNYIDAELTADLDMTNWSSIAPMVITGIDLPAYNGTFNGNGHTIKLTKHSDSDFGNSALFYSIGPEGVVKDLTLRVDFAGKGSGLAYKSHGRVERVTLHGSINVPERGFVGGLVYEASGPNAVFYECANYRGQVYKDERRRVQERHSTGCLERAPERR
ncbi:MAG: hypothetical protein LBQ36_02375 [Synergistaceae bacterium]|nr:hypothetical protein [Synergistaceae bacterium]